jgi:DNA-binding PadR family transcriptional regulator
MTQNVAESTGNVQFANLSAFQRDILLVLKRLENSDDDSYGLAIKRHLENRYDSEVNHGRLYPNLDELIEQDLIERGQIAKRTNRYTLTEAGKELLLAHSQEIEDAFA